MGIKLTFLVMGG